MSCDIICFSMARYHRYFYNKSHHILLIKAENLNKICLWNFKIKFFCSFFTFYWFKKRETIPSTENLKNRENFIFWEEARRDMKMKSLGKWRRLDTHALATRSLWDEFTLKEKICAVQIINNIEYRIFISIEYRIFISKDGMQFYGMHGMQKCQLIIWGLLQY